MSRILWIAIAIPILLLLHACQQGAGRVGTEFFEKIDEIVITNAKEKFPSIYQTNNIFLSLHDNEDLFSTLLRNDSTIKIYAALKDTLVEEIPLSVVYDSINSNYFDVTGYHIHTIDSIFISTRKGGDRVFLINKSGQIQTVRFLDSLKTDNKQDFTPYGIDPYFNQGKLYMPFRYTAYALYADTSDRLKFFDTKVDAVVDFDSNKLLQTNLGYPKFYKNGSYYRARNPEQTINADHNFRAYSFSYSDSVYMVSDISTVSAHFASSKNHEYPKPYNLDSTRNREYDKNYILNNSKFLNIYYDPHQDLYYRVLKHPAKTFVNDTLKNTAMDAAWSIIVLNKEFDKIYEQVFEPKEYLYFLDIIITKKGILIPLHPQNQRYKLDEWNYDLYQIREDELSS